MKYDDVCVSVCSHRGRLRCSSSADRPGPAPWSGWSAISWWWDGGMVTVDRETGWLEIERAGLTLILVIPSSSESVPLSPRPGSWHRTFPRQKKSSHLQLQNDINFIWLENLTHVTLNTELWFNCVCLYSHLGLNYGCKCANNFLKW